MNKAKIVLVQNFPKIGQMEENKNDLEKMLEEKKDELIEVDIIVFPECFLTGYDFPNE